MSPRIPRHARLALPLLVLLALAGLVAAAEALLAWRDPGLTSRDPASGDDGLQFYRFHPQVGLFHKPSFSGTYRGIRYETNSRGLRGPEVPLERTPGRGRVAVLGDSLVWGFGVPQGETLCDALAALRPGLEVLNFGVAGFGAAQELMLLDAEVLAYHPDRVVLVFTLANDVEDSYFPDSAAAYPANLFHLDRESGALRLDRFQLSPWQRLGLWLRHNSYLVAAFAQARSGEARSGEASRNGILADNRRRLAAQDVDWSRYAGLDFLQPEDARPAYFARRGGLLVPTPRSHYKVRLVEQILREADRHARDAGAGFAVVLAPFRAQLGDDSALRDNPLTRELVRFLEAEHIPHLDLLPPLLDAEDRLGPLFLDAMHFSPAGNRLAAERIADALLPAGARAAVPEAP